jgi:hypothetical protein
MVLQEQREEPQKDTQRKDCFWRKIFLSFMCTFAALLLVQSLLVLSRPCEDYGPGFGLFGNEGTALKYS